jgi:hypothetical protein
VRRPRWSGPARRGAPLSIQGRSTIQHPCKAVRRGISFQRR